MAIISVIIPTYNRADYLKLAIESILAQDFQDFEIIITDNASTDHTQQVVEAFQSEKIRYFKNETNIGVVPNHNLALQKAHGEYIHIFSDDDIMYPNNLQVKYEALINSGSLFVHGNIEVINSTGIVVKDSHWASEFILDFPQISNYTQKDNFDRLFQEWNFISMPSVMFHRSLLDHVGYLHESYKFCPDWDYWLRASLVTNFIYIHDKLIQYRVHSTNTIAEASMLQMINEVDHMRNYLFGIDNEHPFMIAKKIIDIHLIKEQQIKRFLNNKFLDTKPASTLTRVKEKINKIFYSNLLKIS